MVPAALTLATRRAAANGLGGTKSTNQERGRGIFFSGRVESNGLKQKMVDQAVVIHLISRCLIVENERKAV